jgi:hypothetical protein
MLLCNRLSLSLSLSMLHSLNYPFSYSDHPHSCSVCDPAKIFPTSKFSCLLVFCNPAHKTETGTANRVKWELLIANHLDGTNHSDWPIKKQGATVRSYLLQSSVTGAHSLAGAQRCCGLTSLRSKYAGEKLFSWAKRANVDFSSSHFNVQGHILSTGGDALTLSCLPISFTALGSSSSSSYYYYYYYYFSPP